MKKAEEIATKKEAAKSTKKGVKKVKDSLEKTTLGDISELAALKSQLEGDKDAKK